MGVITMAIGDYDDRGRLAEDRRAAAEEGRETSVAGIVIGILVVAAIIGFVFFMIYDRSPPGSTATSPTVTAPDTQPRTEAPPKRTTPAPAPSTK
jgi:hypothetical protein